MQSVDFFAVNSNFLPQLFDQFVIGYEGSAGLAFKASTLLTKLVHLPVLFNQQDSHLFILSPQSLVEVLHSIVCEVSTLHFGHSLRQVLNLIDVALPHFVHRTSQLPLLVHQFLLEKLLLAGCFVSDVPSTLQLFLTLLQLSAVLLLKLLKDLHSHHLEVQVRVDLVYVTLPIPLAL